MFCVSFNSCFLLLGFCPPLFILFKSFSFFSFFLFLPFLLFSSGSN